MSDIKFENGSSMAMGGKALKGLDDHITRETDEEIMEEFNRYRTSRQPNYNADGIDEDDSDDYRARVQFPSPNCEKIDALAGELFGYIDAMSDAWLKSDFLAFTLHRIEAMQAALDVRKLARAPARRGETRDPLEQRVEAVEDKIESLERASYRMATDMNGGA